MIKRFLEDYPNFNWKEFVDKNKNLAKRNKLNNKKKVILYLLKKNVPLNMFDYNLYNETHISVDNIKNLDMEYNEFINIAHAESERILHELSREEIL